MKRRRIQKRAFTLIELLVVIAIIAILAAILFPVFAQAKGAAKAAVAISNVKQLSLGSVMYSGDADDTVVRRWRQDYAVDANGNYVGPVTDEVSWKGMIAPYVKSVDLYKDPANAAAKWPDYHSDPVKRALSAWTPVNLPADRKFVRGYAIANLWYPSAGGFQDSIKERTFTTTMFSNPANIFFLVESKLAIEDVAPFAGWSQNFDPATGLQWNLGGDKWSNKANAVGFQDGHAKRMAHSQWCGQDYMSKPDGSSEVDTWNMDAGQKAGWSWIHNGGCGSLPAQFR